ncbi:hypothetical protein AAHZ94_28155 [Streptomyces sp. HSW2009]|uniref:hypothetical protein n=1 Tax=Streptomyces sp. HSW2009 TaxID=3142890 RepID=UPI0032EDCA04
MQLLQHAHHVRVPAYRSLRHLGIGEHRTAPHRRDQVSVGLAQQQGPGVLAQTPARRLYALMSLHPTGTFTEDVARAVARTDRSAPTNSVAHCLATLHSAGLYTFAQGRYSMPPQVHQHAREQALTHLRIDWNTRHEAQIRLADHYLATATEAGRALLPDAPAPAPTRVYHYSVDPPAFADPGAAKQWFANEHLALARVLEMTHTMGLPSLTAHLAVASWPTYLHHTPDAHWRNGQHAGEDAARTWGMRQIEGLLLVRRATVLCDQHLPESALPALRHAALAYQTVGDRDGLATTWRTTGLAYLPLGRVEMARRALQAALAYRRPLNAPARAIDRLAMAELESRTGRHQEAAGWLRAALASATPGSPTEVRIRRQAALTQLEHGDVTGALTTLERALDVAHAGDPDLMETELSLTYTAQTKATTASGRTTRPPRPRGQRRSTPPPHFARQSPRSR